VVVAVVMLSLLCLLNLLLTVGVVRRLKEHTTALEMLAGPLGEVMQPAGGSVADYAATTVDGTAVGRELLLGPTLVGFFSPGCGPCRERLPEFVARAAQAPAGRVLAVVVQRAGAPAEEGQAMVADLAGAAPVVVEPPGGSLSTSFGVRGFPAFGLLEPSGQLVASGTELSAIPILVAS
jgi:thiol-disulfide isomerase/thioredoxin